jgi:hypothetical protein
MSGTRAAFGAYFSRSALFDRSGLSSAWLIYLAAVLLSSLAVIPGVTRADALRGTLFWSLFAGTILGQQLTRFLHRLTTGTANLVPAYRDCQWRAFRWVILIAIGGATVPFLFTGMGFGAIGAALAVVGMSVWFMFRFPLGILILFAVALAFQFGASPTAFLTAFDSMPAWPLIGAGIGVCALWDVSRRYRRGAVIAGAAKIAVREVRFRQLGFDWPVLSDLDRRWFARRLARPAMRRNEIARLADGMFRPVWASGLPIIVFCLIVTGTIWLVSVGTSGGHAIAAAAFGGYLIACLLMSHITMGQFEQCRQWQHYWLAFPAATRRAFTTKLAFACALVQCRSLIAATAIYAALVVGFGDMAPGRIVLAVAFGINIFMLASGSILLLLPFRGRLWSLPRALLYVVLWAIAAGIGTGADLLSSSLPSAARAVMVFVGIGAWGVLLIVVGLQRLPTVDFATRDADGVLRRLYGL